ncbi:MAG: class I SAM-dependent methyltransferase [Proteobacteria bacterium]|nr:class I SAM-dependent methyltransferase [Pseudomonadota bacterium]MCP4916941.1 class I SAM-dependent methyltransferase [Pseudomonadota bacterium]
MSWHDSDAFWHDMQGVMFDARRWAAAQDEIDALLALLRIDGGRALDMPCGVGRHSIALARRGFEVTGLDRTARYLEVARSRAEDQDVTFVQGDMREGTGGGFDLAVNLYSSFGYFDDPADDRRTLEAFHGSLAPGGRLVLDTMSVEVLAMVFEKNSVIEREHDLLIERRRILKNWRYVESTWTVLGHDGSRTDGTFRVRLYGARELAGLLMRAGFGAVEAYGGLDGRPYDDSAKRLVLVAHKDA